MSTRTAATTLRLADGTDLVIQQHFTDVTSSGHYEPDPAWQHLDEDGHLHAWVGKLLPTLEERWCDHRECDSSAAFLGHFCKACGEKVEPCRKWTGEQVTTLPGLREITRQGRISYGAPEMASVKADWIMSGNFRCRGEGWVEICQPLTPAEAADVVEAIGLPERSLTLKSNLISMLRGLAGVSVDVEQPEAEVLPLRKPD